MIRSAEDRATIQAAKAIQVRERKASKRARPPMVVKRGQEPRILDPKHLARIRRLPCLPTLITTGVEVKASDACHVRFNYPNAGWGGNPGAGRKPHDWRTLPMTRAFHEQQHHQSEKQFWADLNVYPPHVCAALRDALSLDAMLNVIRNTARMAREVEG